MMTIPKLHIHILQSIQGVFSELDMAVLKEEIEKLKPDDVYVEIGVDEGRSARVAHEYAKKGVYKIYIDIHNVDPHEKSIGRGKWMEQEGMVGIGKKGFFVHGDADVFADILEQPVDLLFIDGHHNYESIKENTLAWEGNVSLGGTILFHDYDHPEVKRWLDEHYKNDKEIIAGGKMVRVKIGRIKK